MTDDIHSLARRLEALDEQIADLNADKASVWADAKKLLREDLPAFREAIAQRRKRDKNPAAYEALKGRAAEYLDALDNGIVLEHARAPARARGSHQTDRAALDGVSQVPAGVEGRAGTEPTPESSAAVASIPVPLPRTDVEAPPPAALDTEDDWKHEDMDAGWEKADSAGNYQVALEVLAERARAAKAAPVRFDPVQSGSVLQDAGPIPDFLDRRKQAGAGRP